MDIVGPLVKRARGHHYILVVCNYATKFREALLQHTITALTVLQALVQLFSRMGNPNKILNDQGTYFTSCLLQMFHKQLGIPAIKITPYHTQTDGLEQAANLCQVFDEMPSLFTAKLGRTTLVEHCI